MGARIRATDWAQTSLGPPDAWPQSLRSAVSILLPSKAQIALFWGPDLVTIYNDAYRPVFGAKHPAALGKPIREAWSELWRSGLEELFDGVRATGEAFWSRDRPFFMERHGYLEETYFDVSYDPVRDESGRVGGVFCIVSETTGRVVGERRLRALRDLRGIAQHAVDPREAFGAAGSVLAGCPEDVPFALLYGVEGDGDRARLMSSCGIDPASPAAPSELGAAGPWPTVDELRIVEGDALDALPPLQAGPWPERIGQVAVVPFALPGEASQGFLVAAISPRRRVDADYRDFLRLAAATIASTVAAARRADDERRRARALAELDRAKTAFFSNVSHEFRTPLTLMLGPLEDALADRSQPLDGVQRERLELARRSGLRLQKLVNALLDFARIEAGRTRASYVETDLGALTSEVASSFRSAMEKAGLAFSVEVPASAPRAWVDREMWEKIVLNLLSNAFKFTFEGAVTVRLRATRQAFELTVSDTGVGIPAAELPHVFERFRRVEGGRSRTHEGTGIGLALVQELARLHGGTVHAQSVEGRGSTFTVHIAGGRAHLPADHLAPGTPPVPAGATAEAFVEEAVRWLPDGTRDVDARERRFPPVGNAAGARARILLADDNADMRRYVERLLCADYDVETVADGEAALAAARARRPDLVLADVMMPRMDGLALARSLRADPLTRLVSLVLLSARAGEDARLEGLAAGADDYIEKPFTARELAARVAARLEVARLRREGDAALRAREHQLRLIADHVPVLIVQCDADARYTFVNEPYAARFGVRPEDVVGRRIEDLVGAATYASLRSHVDAALHGRRVEFEERVEFPGLGPRWVHSTYVPQVEPDGGIGGFVAVVHDVTARRQAEQELREREAHLRAVVETSPECVKLVANDGTLLEMNASGLAMVGADRPDLVVGRCVYDLIAPEHREAFRAFNERVCAGRRAQLEFDIVGLRAERRSVETHAAPLRLPDGSVAQLALTRDVTARRAAESALRESDRRKAEFLAMLSHELRNPLAPLRNALQILQLRGAKDADAAQIHAMMARQLDVLVRLVDDLLEMSRIDRGSFELRCARLDAAGVVRSAIESSAPLVREAGLVLETSLPREGAWIDGDHVRLAQILVNLLNNAVRHSEPGGRITIAVTARDGRIDVVVRDTGVGFTPEFAQQLFGMFTRGERSTGLGIGLALGRRLAEMHGGTLEGWSAGPGRGAEFVLRLPQAAEPADAGASGAGPAPAIGGQRVLVVDDNRDAAESLRMLLEALGADVRVAGDGREALAVVGPFDPDVVVLDIGMPGLDGYEVARTLRRRFPAGRPVIVALSGFGQDEDRRRSRDAGFDHHLVKPANLPTLQRLLGSLHARAAQAAAAT